MCDILLCRLMIITLEISSLVFASNIIVPIVSSIRCNNVIGSLLNILLTLIWYFGTDISYEWENILAYIL